jgi:hypothetical protein
MDGDGGRWLTYGQLAETRGITRKAAIRMTQRHRWRRQPGNDGTALVWVPSDDLTPRQLPPRQPSRQTPDDDGDGDTPGTSVLTKALAALEDAVAALREQLDTANARADRAEQGRDGERARADGLRDRLTTMQEQLADAHASLQAAESAGARAEQAEQGKERAETSLAAERARADALRERIEALQVQLVARQEVIDAAEAEGAASDVETADLTAQLKQARAEARAAQERAEALQRDEGPEGEGRPGAAQGGVAGRMKRALPGPVVTDKKPAEATGFLTVTPCAVITATGRCRTVQPSGASQSGWACRPCSRGVPPARSGGSGS